MQESDVNAAARLFEMAGDGTDEAEWQAKFNKHTEQVMGQHSTKLMAGANTNDKRAEYIRAKLELHEMVLERIVARTQRTDRGASEALEAVQAANLPLIQEACGMRATPSNASSPPGRSRTPRTERPANVNLENSTSPDGGGGAGAFAAALARERGVSTRPTSPSQSPTEEDTMINLGYARMAMGSAGGALSVRSPSASRGVDRHALPSPRLPKRYAEIHSHGCHATSALNGAQVSASRPGKDLSLRQLRHVMNSLYESKAQHDVRCNELKEPNETLEQHLYGFLSRRYGVRSVVQEWAQAIFRAINRWGPQECDVAVFGKILQNQLAESFSAVQDTLRASVAMLLKKYVHVRNPQRPQAEMDALWRARVQRGIPYAECERVVRYMYNERDSEAVLHRVKKAVAEWSQNPQAEPDSVRYRDLVQILLRFQMELTEGFLADFVKTFADADQDEDGIVNQPELQEIVNRLLVDINYNTDGAATSSLNEARLQVIAAIRDYQRATFSECVDIFTGMVSARWAILKDTRQRAASENSPRSLRNNE